jgi:transporter family protein
MADVNKVVPVDKSSTVLTVILAIIFFNETNHIAAKLIGVTLIAAGVYLMIEKRDLKFKRRKKGWFIYAALSAVFAALTAILGKVGISDVESNLGTAIRTGVVLVMAWLVVFGRGKHKQIKTIDKKELLFIGLSGIATGASWLCYYYAIQNGDVSVVGPVEKLNILVAIAFSRIEFKEKLKKRSAVGLTLMVIGTVVIAIWA